MQILILCSIVSCVAMPALALWLMSRISVIEKGKELESNGQIDQAVQLYKAAINSDPSDCEVKYRLFSIKMKTDPEFSFSIASELSENTELSKNQLISIQTFLLNHYKKINNIYGLFLTALKLVFLGAENYEAFLWLAKIYGAKGKREKFEEYIKRAIKNSDNDESAIYLYSLYLFSEGNNAEARNLLENVKGSDEIMRKAYYALACYYFTQDSFTASVWLEALNDITDNLEFKIHSLLLLGVCRLKLGDSEAAFRHLDELKNFITTCDSEYIRIYRCAYIWALHINGNTSEALASLKRLSENDFDFIDLTEAYTMGTNDGFIEVEKIVMKKLSEFPKPTILSALSDYGSITCDKVEGIFKKWRLAFKDTAGFNWILNVKDFKELNFQEFIEVARHLPHLFDLTIETEITSLQGFSAFVIDKISEKYLLEILPWGSVMSNMVIKEFGSRMDDMDKQKGIIIVPGQFSKKAHEDADMYNIRIIDGPILQEALNKFN